MNIVADSEGDCPSRENPGALAEGVLEERDDRADRTPAL